MQSAETVSTIGERAVKRWAHSLGIPPPPYGIEVLLDVVGKPAPLAFDVTRATRFHIGVWPAEWDFFFCHAGRASWIRVTDVAFVHGKDDFGLLARTPQLEEVGRLIRELEREHGARFRRDIATVRADADARDVVGGWVQFL